MKVNFLTRIGKHAQGTYFKQFNKTINLVERVTFKE